MDTDTIFARALIYGTPADVERVKTELRHFHGQECPECASPDGLQENSSGASYLCTACGHQWDAAEVEVTLVEYVEDLATCQGHPAGPFDPMGVTVYCDGSCRKRRRR